MGGVIFNLRSSSGYGLKQILRLHILNNISRVESEKGLSAYILIYT